MEKLDDELVISVIQYDDHAAFASLVRRYQAPIYYSLLKLTHDHTLAEDLSQNTFLQAYRKLDQYQLGRSFKAWLGGIAYKEFLQASRAKQNENKKIRHFTQHSISIDPEAIPESLIDLDKALSKLKQAENTVLLLTFLFGMSDQEIATLLEKPLGTIKSRIKRSKDKLTALMKS